MKTQAIIAILCLAAASVSLNAQENKNPAIMGVQLGDTVEKVINLPQIQKLEEVESANGTQSFLSPMKWKPATILESYQKSIQTIKDSKVDEIAMYSHPAGEIFWIINARFRDVETKPQVLGLEVYSFEVFARYNPKTTSFQVNDCTVRLTVPSDSDPKQAIKAVNEILTQQFGKPTEVDKDMDYISWKNVGENKTDLTLRDGVAGNIAINIKSPTLDSQTSTIRANRLTELRKPAPVSGKLE